MSIVEPCCTDAVQFLSFSILYNRNCKISSLKCKIVFPQSECVERLRVYKGHNVVY